MAKRRKPLYSDIRNKPPVSFIRRVLSYHPTTGKCVWLATLGYRGQKGSRAGSLRKDGRRYITIAGKHYRSTHIAWVIMKGKWPRRIVDHKNNDPSDDKWNNLRLATKAQNQRNSKQRAHSMQPYKGCRRHRNKWVARIVVNWKEMHLGSFNTAEQARDAYQRAAKKYHGRFARAA